MKTEHTHLYVPTNFQPESCLPPHLHKHTDCARYLVHRIIWGQIVGKAMPDDFVPLKFDYLRQVIPDRVLKPLKVALTEAGVIECDGHYIEGHKSLGYRLGPSYRSAPVVRVVIKEEKTAERVQANRRTEFKKIKLNVHKHLRSWLHRLEIDREAALASLAKLTTYERVRIPVEQIAAKDFHFTVCRYGRVHTTLTGLSGLARSALQFRGSSLVSLDVANSQPLFLALILINYRQEGNKLLSLVTFSSSANPYEAIDLIIARTISPFLQEDSLPDTPLSITTRIEGGGKPQVQSCTALTESCNKLPPEPNYESVLAEDELAFIGLCEQGQLYDTLKTHLEPTCRKLVKQELFAYIFGKNSHQSQLRSAFRELFPHVAEVIHALKRKDYAFLPRLMQNVEAHTVINRMCRRLMIEHPQVPIWTIHDSLLTTPQHRAIVEGVMRQEFKRLGLSPTLHIKEPP